MVKNHFIFGAVAQLGERLTGSQEVDGSIPFSSTKIIKELANWLTPFLMDRV